MDWPVAYQGTKPYIFISYAHKDSQKVLPLITALQQRGFRVWYDAGIEIGSEWPEYIAEHLYNSSCVLAFLSQAALDSHNCRREINFAIELRKNLMIAYLEDINLTLGMRMQLNSLQAIYCHKYPSISATTDALTATRLLDPCKDALPEDKDSPKQEVVPEVVPSAAVLSEPEHTNDEVTVVVSDVAIAAEPEVPIVAESEIPVPTVNPEAELLYQHAMQIVTANNPAYNKIRSALISAADLGHTLAKRILAHYYLFAPHPAFGATPGFQDVSKAFALYQEAASANDPEAQFALHYCYTLGVGTEKDEVVAKTWLDKACQQEYAPALAISLFSPQRHLTAARALANVSTAEQLMKVTLHYNNCVQPFPADVNLWFGKLYLYGYGVEQNNALALEYLRAAAKEKAGSVSREAETVLITELKKSPEVTDELIHLCARQAAYGNLDEAFFLGRYYYNNHEEEAVGYLTLAATNGHKEAMIYLSICYREGICTKRNLVKAMYWEAKYKF